MVWIVLSVSIIIVTICVYIIWNLQGKVEVLERELLKGGELEDSVMVIYEFFLKTFTHALNEMNRVDKNGAYSSDDEVGFAFRVVMDSIEQVKLQIEKLRVDDEPVVTEKKVVLTNDNST